MSYVYYASVCRVKGLPVYALLCLGFIVSRALYSNPLSSLYLGTKSSGFGSGLGLASLSTVNTSTCVFGFGTSLIRSPNLFTI